MREESREHLKSSHTPDAIRKRLGKGIRRSYLKDFIYGAVDGTVTTFAVVSGVAGAQLSNKIIIILGCANLIADGFSMAVSNFLGTRADQQRREQVRKTEENHVRVVPEGEEEEIRQIFAEKGFSGKRLEDLVHAVTSDPKQWVNTMLQEEWGLSLGGISPRRAATATFTAFILAGSIPLSPFVFQRAFSGVGIDPFLISSWMTAVSFVMIGAFKAPFVGQRWYWGGLETLLAGGGAAVLAYSVGHFLKGWIPS